MKKALALLLLLFILFNSMGYYVLFELDKLMVRKEMNARLSESKTVLTCLTIDKGDKNPSFHRIRNGEVEYDGRLYDVLREVRKGESIVIFCLRDTKEEQLYAGLKKISHDNQKTSLWDYIVKIALPEGQMNIGSIASGDLKFAPYWILYSSITLTSLGPPPEIS